MDPGGVQADEAANRDTHPRSVSSVRDDAGGDVGRESPAGFRLLPGDAEGGGGSADRATAEGGAGDSGGDAGDGGAGGDAGSAAVAPPVRQLRVPPVLQ